MTPARYDAWYDSPSGRWMGETELALLLRLLAPHPGESLLDVGCGSGWFTRRLAARGLAVTGLDIDPAMLAYAQGRDAATHYLRGDASALPFADGAFDTVVSVTALCFVPDWRRALGEMVRVARRRVVVGLLNRHSLLWRRKGRQGGVGGYQGARWHTGRELRQALATLPVRRVRPRTALFLPGAGPLARRLERLLPSLLPWGGFLAVVADLETPPKPAGPPPGPPRPAHP